MKSPRSPTSSWLSPPAGSSRRSSRGPGGERARDLDPLLGPVREVGGGSVRHSAEPEIVDEVPRGAVAAACVAADEHVLEHGHRPEELDVLERARDPRATTRCGGVRSSDSPSSSSVPSSGV